MSALTLTAHSTLHQPLQIWKTKNATLYQTVLQSYAEYLRQLRYDTSGLTGSDYTLLDDNIRCKPEELSATSLFDGVNDFSERIELTYRENDFEKPCYDQNSIFSALMNSTKDLYQHCLNARTELSDLFNSSGFSLSPTDFEVVLYLIRYKPLRVNSDSTKRIRSQRHYDFTLYTLIYQMQIGLFVKDDFDGLNNLDTNTLVGLPGVQAYKLGDSNGLSIFPTIHGVRNNNLERPYRFSMAACYYGKNIEKITKIPPELLPFPMDP